MKGFEPSTFAMARPETLARSLREHASVGVGQKDWAAVWGVKVFRPSLGTHVAHVVVMRDRDR